MHSYPRMEIDLALSQVMLPPQRADATAAAFTAAADQLIIPDADSLAACRAAVASLQLDVLIYADIGMDAISYALGFSRLAAIQATVGHAWPVTTGIRAIDYFVTFEAEAANAEQHYTERLLRLPGILPYPQPIPAGPSLEHLRRLHDDDQPAELVGGSLAELRAEFGLPVPASRAVVYLCIQAPYKFHPDFDAAVTEILTAVPGAVFAMLRGKARHWTDTLLSRLNQTLGPELMRRVVVLPRTPSSRMPSLLAAADVVLDTWPYGGGVTSFEALTVGRPLVTLAHRTLPGRFTYAFYLKMGLLDAVAFTQSEYVAVAAALGRSASARAALSQRIVDRVGVLFDDGTAREALETKLQVLLAELKDPAARALRLGTA